jgi:parallel beta-helix repeat protein
MKLWKSLAGILVPILALSVSLLFSGKVSADATTQPLLHQSDMVYQGSFQLPGGNFGMENGTFEYAGPLTSGNVYNDPVHGKTLFMAGYLEGGYISDVASIAQIKIPSTLADSDVVGADNLPAASIVQGFDDPSNGKQSQILSGVGTGHGNVLVYNGKLIGTASSDYDAGCAQSKSAWVTSINFGQKSQATGPYAFNSPVMPRLVAGGYLTLIPSEWQSLLGGKVVSGDGPWSIITCSNSGPSLHVIDADALVAQPPSSTNINSIPLVYYDYNHPSLGEWNSNLPGQVINGKLVPSITVTDPRGRGNFTFAYNDSSAVIDGVLFPDGSRSVLFFGKKGMGAYCYGTGGASGGDCYDPDYTYKGGHAFPYTEFVWAYDANDLLAAKNGTKNPWDVLPYTGWAFKVNGDDPGGQRVSVSWDAATRTAYVVVAHTTSARTPTVHAYQIGTPVLDTEFPTWPTGTTFSASATSSSSITVTWSAATDNIGVTNYTVQRCTGLPAACPDASFATVGTPTASPFVNNTGLSPNTDYSYRVRASDAAGNTSGWTNTVSARTQAVTPAPTFTLSANPTSITSGASSTLTWSAVTNATSCTTSGGTFTGSKSTSGGTQSVSPTSTTIYTLSCTGAGGTTNQTATVTVSGGTGRTISVHNLSELYNAFSSEQASDTIVIYPDGSPYTLNSTALAIDQPNITVRGSTGNRNDVIIRGDAMSSGAVIKMIFLIDANAADAVTIKDLSVGRVGWHLIKFSGENNAGHNSVIDNVRLFDSYEQMIKVSAGTEGGDVGADNVIVKNSLFEYTAGVGPQYYIGGIDAHRSTGWIVQDNTFRDIQSPSGSVAEHAVHFWGNSARSANHTIERNTIINCDRGIGLWLNSGGTIRNNMILHDGSGAYPDVAIDIQNSPNVRVYNNTSWIAASGYYTNIELRGSTSTGLVLTNNLVNKGIGNISAPSPTLTSNITTAQASWFVNVASNLHLASSVSSVVNQGVAVSGLTDDIDKQSRPQGSSIDIGADEYVSGGAFSLCNTVTTANFSQAAYNSYGAPFDAFQTSTNLINATCSSSDPHTIQATLGQTGDTTRIVYTKGYYYANSNWTQYSGTCTGALNGDWCQGSVSATITNPNISTASASAPAYFVGMTCSVQGGGWKCGCRDTMCANFYWMIQGAGQ